MYKGLLITFLMILFGLLSIGFIAADDTFYGQVEAVVNVSIAQPKIPGPTTIWVTLITTKGNILETSKTFICGKLASILKANQIIETGDFIYIDSDGNIVITDRGL